LIFFYLKSICTTLQGGYYDFRRDKIDTIPISNSINSNIEIEELVNVQITNFTKNQNISKSFTKYLQSQFNIEKLSKKLQTWHELEFADFIKELNKAIKKANKEVATATTSGHVHLTKKDEMEWMELFEEKKAEAQTLKTEIEKTDKEIDQMVYELYGLTGDEIKIVEGY
jgi:hypothetical protein